MKVQLKRINLGLDKLAIIEKADAIIQEFQALGYTLTLRQLYYQFIGRKLLPDSWIDEEYNRKNGLAPDTKNTIKNYKRLGDILVDGRLAGLIDLDAMEDRGREVVQPSQWESLDSLLESALAAYRLDRWKDQPCYAELWCEKDALSGVLEPVARQFHVPFMANKGYSSLSAMYAAANRFRGGCGECASALNFRKRIPQRPGVILYVGDHDPSGVDMVRDIADRMAMFLGWPAKYGNSDVSSLTVVRLALNLDQVEEYDLPPDPAKVTDGRAKKYIEEFGEGSWELDALRPNTLVGIVEEGLEQLIDHAKMQAIIDREQRDKDALREFMAQRQKPPPKPSRGRKKAK